MKEVLDHYKVKINNSKIIKKIKNDKPQLFPCKLSQGRKYRK